MNAESACSAPKKAKRGHLSSGEKQMIKDVYEGIRIRNTDMTVSDAVELCAGLTKVSVRTVYNVLKKKDMDDSRMKPVEKRGRKAIVVDDDTKFAIRRKVHAFYFRNEIPTLKKIAAACAEDNSLPQLSRYVIWRTLREMNFRYLKRNRKSALIEKPEIVTWRRHYLTEIRRLREQGKVIYYMDETWINEGHTVAKVWQDLNVKSRHQAVLEGLSTGLKAPSGKGRRLIIVHIGSNSGFLDGGLCVFESKHTGDYHEEMNAEVFERWFASILPRIDEGSVIVMDNAPYHSRRIEQLPTTAWRKGQIQNWLTSKQIPCTDTMLKVQLLEIARAHKAQYMKYVVDEMARARGVTVVRLPPYHCELNPIELIWAEVKNEVARTNTTFKLTDVRVLLENAISSVTAESWRKCIAHVHTEEQRMWDLDIRVETLTEPIIIRPDADSSSDDSGSDSESEAVSDT